ncbi:hypothetical protein D3C87_2032580 [compost metagenome]
MFLSVEVLTPLLICHGSLVAFSRQAYRPFLKKMLPCKDLFAILGKDSFFKKAGLWLRSARSRMLSLRCASWRWGC